MFTLIFLSNLGAKQCYWILTRGELLRDTICDNESWFVAVWRILYAFNKSIPLPLICAFCPFAVDNPETIASLKVFRFLSLRVSSFSQYYVRKNFLQQNKRREAWYKGSLHATKIFTDWLTRMGLESSPLQLQSQNCKSPFPKITFSYEWLRIGGPVHIPRATPGENSEAAYPVSSNRLLMETHQWWPPVQWLGPHSWSGRSRVLQHITGVLWRISTHAPSPRIWPGSTNQPIMSPSLRQVPTNTSTSFINRWSVELVSLTKRSIRVSNAQTCDCEWSWNQPSY